MNEQIIDRPNRHRNRIIQVVPDGDWFDPETVIRVKISIGYRDEIGLAIRFKDGDWLIKCASLEEARAYRDRIAEIRNKTSL